MVHSFDINAIARELNSRASKYEIGSLQTIRAKIKGLSRRPGSDIFSSKTISQDWAFHHGGRKELQFNIGAEERLKGYQLRYGVAFSFELSQTLRSIDILIPKVRFFNDYIQLYPERYADMRMWHYWHKRRSEDYLPSPIMPELIVPSTFVFLGKRQPVNEIDFETILRDFDRLLSLYKYVESGGREDVVTSGVQKSFRFRAGCIDKPASTSATLAERELNISLKHNTLQAALCRHLISGFGVENVADEHPSGLGTKIDVVVRHSDDDYWYYEIKTAATPRACIREAIGQILEYAYWPGAREASRLIICGEHRLDSDGKQYLRRLKQRFQLPIEYQRITD